MSNIVIEGTKEIIEENGNKIDPIDVYAKTQHVFAEVSEKIIPKHIQCYCVLGS